MSDSEIVKSKRITPFEILARLAFVFYALEFYMHVIEMIPRCHFSIEGFWSAFDILLKLIILLALFLSLGKK